MNQRKTGALRILAVDDDPDVRQWYRAVYDAEHLATASSMESAMEILWTAELDLILLDLDLGDGRGTDLLELIRTDPVYAQVANVPVVIVTSSKSADDFERTWDLGAVAFVSKPLDIQSLRTAVSEATGR